MNLIELGRALRQLRLSGIADVLETRLVQAQSDNMAPLDFLSALVSDELIRRQDRLLERRLKQAGFRDRGKTLDTFDFDFNKKMDRRLVFELATARFVGQREDAFFLGPPAPARAILPKRSACARSTRATACSIARRMSCSRRSPRPSSPATGSARRTWPSSPPGR